MAQRTLPLSVQSYDNPDAYVHFKKSSWEDFVEAAFSQIQFYSKASPEVTKVLVETIGRIAEQVSSAERAKPLKQLLETANQQISSQEFTPHYQQKLTNAIKHVESTLADI